MSLERQVMNVIPGKWQTGTGAAMINIPCLIKTFDEADDG